MRRIYISAAHKSSGKTTLSIGLCAAFSQQAKKVQSFKKGPDYIDPLWLSKASTHQKANSNTRHCYNLDFNTQTPHEIIHTLEKYGEEADISIIEGNKGLHDGVALDGSDSNAALAALTQTPVILIIDARGVTRGVAPLLMGYQQFNSEVKIAGVIYNFCAGARHEQKLRAVTETYTDIPVLGMLRKSASMALEERHLGLMPNNEAKDTQQKISEIAQFVTGSVDLSKVFDSANTESIDTQKINKEAISSRKYIDEIKKTSYRKPKNVRIGICEDDAFGFYYPDDKHALIDAGAELISINTLKDSCLPEDLDGLFIGGGFPETQMHKLEANYSMRESIFHAVESGLATYAECGGLMYLSEGIEWKQNSAEMVGVIPAIAKMYQKPQGRGYVKLEETKHMLWPSEKTDLPQNVRKLTMIKAHEFHYSSLERLHMNGKFAFKVQRGVGITGEYDGWVYKNLLANYSHLRHTQAYSWAGRFVEFVRQTKQCKINNSSPLSSQADALVNVGHREGSDD